MKATDLTVLFILLHLCLVINTLHLKQQHFQQASKSLGDKNLFLKDSHNYFVTQAGNQVWAGALSLAWHELTDNIIKDNIQVGSSNQFVLKIVDNFNKCPFKRQDLNQNDYYIKSGFGQSTVNQINSQVKAKFPEKTFPDIDLTLQDKDIISYAYLFKKFQYPTQFKKVEDFKFKNKTVEGFRAQTYEHRNQVKYFYYENQNQFMIKVLTKSKNEGVFYIKTNQKQPLLQKIIQQVSKWQKHPPKYLSEHDYFSMPVVDLDYFREVREIENIGLKNVGFQNYEFSKVYQALKLKIDESGVKVENEGVISIRATSAMVPQQIKPKYFNLNDTFWIILKQEGKYPYLCIKINEPKEKLTI